MSLGANKRVTWRELPRVIGRDFTPHYEQPLVVPQLAHT